jgi:hypothetical protein
MTPISSAGHLSRAVNIEDLRELARRRLPRIVFNYIDGGADGEWTLRENRRAFDAITFRPHQAVAVRACDLRTRVLGAELSMPLLLGDLARDYGPCDYEIRPDNWPGKKEIDPLDLLRRSERSSCPA